MVTLEEIRKKRKIKVLLTGPFSSGKTFTCMKIVDVALRAGKSVLYLDRESGSIEEIENYFVTHNVTELSGFYHECYFDYHDLDLKIKSYRTKSDSDDEYKVDLIIIDPFPLLQICRKSATDYIKEQGYYKNEGKMVKLVEIGSMNKEEFIKKGNLDNIKTFSLVGWQYSLPNQWEWNFKDFITSIPPDILCTLMTPDVKNTLEGMFDYIIELVKSDSGKYKGIPRKIRGAADNSSGIAPEWINPWLRVQRPFCRKYFGKECSEIGKEIEKEQEKEKELVKEDDKKEVDNSNSEQETKTSS
jgi:hypothetical protein